MKLLLVGLLAVGVTQVQAAEPLCDQLADTAYHISSMRQVGYDRNFIISTYAQSAESVEMTDRQRISIDNMNRYIADKVFANPLHDASPSLQRATDQQVANSIRDECKMAQAEQQ